MFCPADFLHSSPSPHFKSLKSFYIFFPHWSMFLLHTAPHSISVSLSSVSIYISSVYIYIYIFFSFRLELIPRPLAGGQPLGSSASTCLFYRCHLVSG